MSFSILATQNSSGFATVLADGTDGPEGNATAIPGSWCRCKTLGNDWKKVTGTGNTGWVLQNAEASVASLLAALDTAAYQPTTAFATAAQGATADTAVQPGSLGATAFSNDYNDLDNLPSIPAAQVNSDWSAVSGVAEILNKPSALPPNGSAGGSLTGTYPNPTLIGELTHRIYAGGSLKTGTFQCITNANSSGASVTFNLTTDGTPTGTAIFTNVYLDSIKADVRDLNIDFRYANAVLSVDKKTLTMDVAQRTFTGVTVLSINVLGSTQVVNLTNGTTVRLSIIGD